MLRKLSLLIAVSVAAAFAQLTLAQTGGSTLATATGFRFTENDLSADGRKLYDQESKLIAENRRGVFNEWVFQQLVETEAKARGLTAEKVEAEALAKAEKPTEVQIKAVYDKNRLNIGSRTLEDVRPNIIEFLQQEAGGKQRSGLFESLKTKYKFASIKDAGLPLKAADVLVSFGARQITVGEFEIANRIALYNFRANVYEQIRADLENAIFAKLLDAEAKKRNTDASGLIAAEVTNKLKNYSNKVYLTL